MLKPEQIKLINFAAAGDIINLRFMLQVADPRGWDSHALKVAAENGRTECVLALMHRCDPKARGSIALVAAAEGNHEDCVRLLVPVSDLERVAGMLKRRQSKHAHNPVALVGKAVRQHLPNHRYANYLFS